MVPGTISITAMYIDTPTHSQEKLSNKSNSNAKWLPATFFAFANTTAPNALNLNTHSKYLLLRCFTAIAVLLYTSPAVREHRTHATSPAKQRKINKKISQQQHELRLPAEAAALTPATVPGVPSEDKVLIKIVDER